MPLSIGHRSYIGSYKFYPYLETTINIGKFCSLADDITFFTGGNHRYDTPSTFPFNELKLNSNAPLNSYYKKPSSIGNDVWIGCNTVIMPGVHIGDGSVVAAYSIVTKDVEPYSVVGGNPIKVIKKRFSEDIIKQLLEIKWWDLDDNIIIDKLSCITDINEFIEEAKKYIF